MLRAIISFFTHAGMHYTVKEQLFFAVAWTPKATLQAALSGIVGGRRELLPLFPASHAPNALIYAVLCSAAAVPLTMIEKVYKGQPDYDEWYKWGQEVSRTRMAPGHSPYASPAVAGLAADLLSRPCCIANFALPCVLDGCGPCYEGIYLLCGHCAMRSPRTPQVLTTGIFTIVIAGPLGVTLIHYLAPKLLQRQVSLAWAHGLGPMGAAGKQAQGPSVQGAHVRPLACWPLPVHACGEGTPFVVERALMAGNLVLLVGRW